MNWRSLFLRSRFGLIVFLLTTAAYFVNPNFATSGIDPGHMKEHWNQGEIGVLWPKILYLYYSLFEPFSASLGTAESWGMIILPQILFVSLTFGYALNQLNKMGSPDLLSAAIAIFVSVYPTFLLYNLNGEKDTLAVLMSIILFTKLLKVAQTPNLLTTTQNKNQLVYNYISLGLILFLTLEVRTNNLFIVLFVAVALLIIFRKNLKLFIITGITFLILLLVLQLAVFATGKKSVSVSLQDVIGPEAVIVSAIYNNPNSNIPDDLNLFFTNLGDSRVDLNLKRTAEKWGKIYSVPENQISSDAARLDLHNPWKFDDVKDFALNSLKLCTLNLGTCIEAYNKYSASAYNPLQPSFNYSNDSSLSSVSNRYFANNNIFLASLKFINYLFNRFIITNYALQFWIYLAVFIFFIVKRKFIYATLFLIPIGCWLSLLIFSPVHQIRYYLPLIYLFPLVLNLFYVIISQRKDMFETK